MDNRSVPSSPAHHQVQNNGQQESGSQERLQPTPPSAFQFPGVGIPPSAQPVLNQPGYPLQAHVLVDPVTGQHYIVPQPYYPQMQPMYYPPPQAQPMYFHQYQKGAPTPQQQMYMGMPMYNGMPTTSRSDSGSGSKEKDGNQDDKNGGGEEDTMSITSNTSRNSFNLMQNQKIGVPQFGVHRENSRDYMYRTPTVNLPTEFEYSQPLRSPMARPLPLHRLESDPSRGGTQSDFEGRLPKNNFSEIPHASSSDVETARRNYTRIPATPITENEVETEVLLNEEVKKPKQAPSKSIRMEINLADVPTLPRDSKPARRSNATAFTVDMGGEREVSLQEAARNLAENRRKKLENKLSEDRPERVVERNEQLPSNRANKNYLLGKLLTGKNSTNHTNSNEFVDSSPDNEAGSEVGSSRDFDARSEALTFIIDTSKRTNPVFYNQNQYKSKVVQYSDDDDSSSDSEIMEQRSPAPKAEIPKPAPKIDPPRQLPSPRVTQPPIAHVSKPVSVAAPTPSTSTSSTPRTPTSFNRSTGSNPNSDFLQELAKLRMMAGLPASGVGGSDSDSRKTTTSAFRRAETTSSARSPTVSSTQKVVSTRASFNSKTKEVPIPTTVTPTPSRKSESRRSLTGNSSPQLSNIARPPFRTGAPRGIMIGQSEQQREQERNAWLRRKDYNPMKSAAAGRKTSDQRTREQQFTSRRSLTFHPSNTEDMGQSPSPAMIRPARNRSQEPRDMRSEKYRAAPRRGDEPKLTGLAKAVDMLSRKCKKSIELIRIQNKGCLSVSVEDLLTAAAEEPRLNESLDEQLERLSDAFDAVQRYLEQYSLDGYNSPVPESYYDEEDESVESNSTFSGVSTHQNHQSGESISSSYRRKVLDS